EDRVDLVLGIGRQGLAEPLDIALHVADDQQRPRVHCLRIGSDARLSTTRRVCSSMSTARPIWCEMDRAPGPPGKLRRCNAASTSSVSTTSVAVVVSTASNRARLSSCRSRL